MPTLLSAARLHVPGVVGSCSHRSIEGRSRRKRRTPHCLVVLLRSSSQSPLHSAVTAACTSASPGNHYDLLADDSGWCLTDSRPLLGSIAFQDSEDEAGREMVAVGVGCSVVVLFHVVPCVVVAEQS